MLTRHQEDDGYPERTEILQSLMTRQAGLDKLFAFMADHIVPDPDIVLRRDPKLYERISRDPQVHSVFNVRKLATATLDWELVPADEHEPVAVALADECEQRLRQFPKFYEFLDNILEGVLRGLSLQELVWHFDHETGAFLVRGSFPVNKDRVVITDMGDLRLKTPQNSYHGVPLKPYKYVPYVYDIEDASYADPMTTTRLYHGRGIADRLYYILYFKNNVLRFLLRALERNVSPQKILYVPPNDTTLQNKLMSILKALENDSTVVIPLDKSQQGTQGIVDNAAGRSGVVASQVFQRFIEEYCDRMITKVIVGQTLTTDVPSVGSYSLGRVHEATFNKIVRRDSTSVADTLSSTLVAFDMQINRPGVPKSLWPKFKFHFSDIVDIQMFLGAAQQLIQMGLSVSERQIREITGIKAPDPSEPQDEINLMRPAMIQQMVMARNGMTMGSQGDEEGQEDPDKPNNQEQDNE
jgi:phage gp29-like protein